MACTRCYSLGLQVELPGIQRPRRCRPLHGHDASDLGSGNGCVRARENASLFNRPSIRASIAGWFKRFAAAFKAPKPISHQASSLNVSSVFGQPRLVREVKSGAPLEAGSRCSRKT